VSSVHVRSRVHEQGFERVLAANFSQPSSATSHGEHSFRFQNSSSWHTEHGCGVETLVSEEVSAAVRVLRGHSRLRVEVSF